MKQYTAKIYLDYDTQYLVLMEQEQPCMGKNFIRNVELCMDGMPAGTDRIKAEIFRDGQQIACMIRRNFKDGSQIRTMFRIRDGWPYGMCSRYINRLK